MQRKQNKVTYDVAVIGGGASGMVAAIAAKRGGASVILIEGSARLGKKILATGNGKCNALPAAMDANKYNTSFACDILCAYDVQKIKDFFREIGILFREDNGRLYPYSFQATSVQNALRNEVEKLGITVAVDTKIAKILHNKTFELPFEDGSFCAKKVIISVGSPAGFGANSLGLFEGLGIKTNSFYPSLCPIITDKEPIKGLRGVRTNAGIKAFAGGKEFVACTDEVLFKDNGLSGTAIFEISVHIARKYGGSPAGITLCLDFAPDLSETEVANFVEMCLRTGTGLEGLAHKEIIKNVSERVGVSPKDNGAFAKKFANVFKNYQIKVVSLGNFDLAQVSSGGADTSEFNSATLECKKIKGLYATGECLDVDGECGGYNLHWAWASGLAAGSSAAKSQKGE